MTVIFDPLTSQTLGKLKTILDARHEDFASNVSVSNEVIPGRARMVTIVPGPGLGSLDTLDDTTQRINVYADDEGDCEDLAVLIRAIYESPAPFGLVDGDPITRARVTAGPVPVPNDTTQFQQYMVANITRRGREFR